MILVSSCSCLCPFHLSQVLSREWRCSWSSADRWCSNYIWVINNFIAYYGATYIRGLMVTNKFNTSCRPLTISSDYDFLPHQPSYQYLITLSTFSDLQFTNFEEHNENKNLGFRAPSCWKELRHMHTAKLYTGMEFLKKCRWFHAWIQTYNWKSIVRNAIHVFFRPEWVCFKVDPH